MPEFKHYLMVTAKFPAHKNAEVSEKKQELDKKLPLDAMGAKVITGVVLPTLEGFKTIFIASPPEEKFLNYIEHITTRQIAFSEVEGYVFKTEICTKLNYPFE